jgi:hypothetical protein
MYRLGVAAGMCILIPVVIAATRRKAREQSHHPSRVESQFLGTWKLVSTE